jgi:hypothetical protein
MKPNQAEKLFRKTKKIHGWFSFEAAMLFAWIDDIQKSSGLVGDIFEIGVHHGKSAVFLGAMLDPILENLSVCDLFWGPNQERFSLWFRKSADFGAPRHPRILRSTRRPAAATLGSRRARDHPAEVDCGLWTVQTM